MAASFCFIYYVSSMEAFLSTVISLVNAAVLAFRSEVRAGRVAAFRIILVRTVKTVMVVIMDKL